MATIIANIMYITPTVISFVSFLKKLNIINARLLNY